jgi:hypothetical protein
MLRAPALLAACSLAVTACASTTDLLAPAAQLGDGETWLRTDATSYTVTAEPTMHTATIGVTYTNPLPRAVAVPACHRHYMPVLQKLVAGEWVTAFQWVELMCITPPLVIARGETYAFAFPIQAYPRGSNSHPQFQVESIPGTYRLIWFVAVHDPRADAGLGEPLPFELTVSNTFELTL